MAQGPLNSQEIVVSISGVTPGPGGSVSYRIPFKGNHVGQGGTRPSVELYQPPLPKALPTSTHVNHTFAGVTKSHVYMWERHLHGLGSRNGQ